jgi:hypothetical protein
MMERHGLRKQDVFIGLTLAITTTQRSPFQVCMGNISHSELCISMQNFLAKLTPQLTDPTNRCTCSTWYPTITILETSKGTAVNVLLRLSYVRLCCSSLLLYMY